MSRVSAIYPSDKITIREVGLRDGLQLVKSWPDTKQKSKWLVSESNAGVKHFEIGSFLPKQKFPQFSDINELIEIIDGINGVYSSALTMNERGASDAFITKVDELVCVVSATEEHSQANMRRSQNQAIDLISHISKVRDVTAPDKIINAGISMAFGCSISGHVKPVDVIGLAESCLDAGADIVGIADTVGYAGPTQIQELVSGVRRLSQDFPLIVHLHDTRGMAIANAAAALDAGANALDGSLGGLGGCPFAPGATGNVVTEDLIYLCERMGFSTGIDLEALMLVREIAETAMPNEELHGALRKARVPQNMNWRAAYNHSSKSRTQ